MEEALSTTVEQPIEQQPILTEAQAAKYLGVKTATLQMWRYRGLISYIQFPAVRMDKLSRRIHYAVEDLDRFAEMYRVQGGPA